MAAEKCLKQDVSFGAYAYQVIIVGAGFLADAYDLFVIDLVISILNRLHPGGLGPGAKSMIASATLVGAILGQLSFGMLGDWLGRRWTFLATCVLIVLGASLSGCVVWTEPGSPFGLVQQLAFCRFFLGVGVGGEYPLAATIAAEGAPPGRRGSLIAAVFSMQGWGMLISCLVVLVLLAIGAPLEFIWRFALVFGALPSAAVIFIRSKMEETELYKEAQVENVSFSSHLATAQRHIRAYWRPLIGTTMTWLLLDVTFYGTGSFKHRVGSSLDPHAGTLDPRQEVWQETLFATMCCCMAIPGYMLSVAFIDRLGRFNVQLWGFVALSANFALVAALSWMGLRSSAAQTVMLGCFGLTFLFSNFGPNTTTFMLPAEVYPTLVRATCHGLSAAAGKLGAVIGVVAFSPCEARFGIEAVLAGCAFVSLLGAAFTLGFTREAVEDLRELDALLAPTAGCAAGGRQQV